MARHGQRRTRLRLGLVVLGVVAGCGSWKQHATVAGDAGDDGPLPGLDGPMATGDAPSPPDAAPPGDAPPSADAPPPADAPPLDASAASPDAAPSAPLIVGLTSQNQLVSFRANAPANIFVTQPVTGIAGDSLRAIDFRPSNGQLYALGSSSRLYTINPVTAAATAVGAPGAFTLAGMAFGFDFNPVVDVIRVVSDSEQNLRLNPNTGALTALDNMLNPGTPDVTAAAYSNNRAGATATTLYVIDAASKTLMILNPPNSGTLAPVGPLNADTTREVGFDISAAGQAFATLTPPPGTTSRLYTIDLGTGAATLVGTIGSSWPVIDISVAP
jgi:hypothetical protein